MIEMLGQGIHYALSFVLVLSVIVFVHEFGHYFVAKLCGVKIEVFSIGFGREIYGLTDRSGTRWKFSLLPFGGYVKMFGDETAASTPDTAKLDALDPEQRKVSFHFKPLWQKALVVAAGPAANFVLAIAIMTGFLYWGGLTSSEPIVGAVMDDSPAAAAGLLAGDRVISIDGEKVESFSDIPTKIATNLGTSIRLDVLRGKEHLNIEVTPQFREDKDMLGNAIKRPLIGIQSQKMDVKNLSFFQAVGIAIQQTFELCKISLRFLGQMIAGERSTSDLKGPLGIAKMSGQVTQSGTTFEETARMILWFIAMLSVNLGLVNILPVPMLDGGHLMYYGIEAASGRPLARRFQEFGFRIGFYLIIGLMAFSVFNDLRQML